MRTLYLCLFLLSIYSISIFAQPVLHPYNLDFGLSENGSMPIGWRMTSNDKKLGYDAYSTDSISKEHYFYLKITAPKIHSTIPQNNIPTNAGEVRGTVFQTFPSDWFKGKTVKFTAKITYKSKDTSDFLFLIIQTESPRTKYLEVKVSDTIRNSNSDYFSVSALIPTNADLIRIGFILYGKTDAIIEESNFETIYEKGEAQSKLNLTNENYQNLKLLARVYGVTKYFFPDSNLNFHFWENFLYKNVQDAISAKDKNDFINKLRSEYSRIIKEFSIAKSNKENQYKLTSKPYKPLDSLRVMYNYLHHGGVSVLPTELINSKIWNIYESQRSIIATALQIFNVRNKNLKQINLTAKAKFTPHSPSGNIAIGLRMDDPNNYDLLNATSKIITDTTNGWVDLNITTEVPENTASIRLGLLLSGEGTSNFDNLQISATDINDNTFKLDFRNTDFEEPLISTAIPSWLFTQYNASAGYNIELDTINSANGNNSLKIYSDTNFIKFYNPKTFFTEVFDGVEYSIPIQENEFIGQDEVNAILGDESIVLNSNDAISRICIVIDLWNLYRHFGFSHINSSDFDGILESALQIAAENNDEAKFRKALETIAKGDPSFKIWNGMDKTLFFPAINILYEDNKFLIFSKSDKIPSGSQALDIDGVDLKTLISIDKIQEFDNGVNPLSTINKEIAKLLAGYRESQISIKFIPPNSEKSQTAVLKRTSNKLQDIEKPYFSIELEPGLIYLNATTITDEEFKRILPELEKDITKWIIFDFRGYSLLSEHILGFFSSKELTGGSVIIPQYTAPLLNNLQYKTVNALISPLSKLIDKKVVFLMDWRTSSYSEYILGLAKINKIGTIIGSSSQGNFTETNRILLPGYYFATLSSQKFILHDNEINANQPLKPDIEVENTFDNYLNNEDRQLRAAINYLKNKN